MTKGILVLYPALILFGSTIGLVVDAKAETPAIFTPADASVQETLAARELRRYIYLRTGQLLPVVQAAQNLPEQATGIVVARKDRPVLAALTGDPGLKTAVSNLVEQHYLLKTIDRSGRRLVLIVGGDAVGTLYGAYRFAEHLGARFYLHGDVIPDRRIPLDLPVLDEPGKPLFDLRGIQPFHDFPEGPDWWNLDDYKAVISQLPKLRMNFIALHTYPEDRPAAEPTVWIGRPEDVADDGRVKFSYPSIWYNTALEVGWGFAAKKTGDYTHGASQLFDRDAYGGDVMRDLAPRPQTPDQCNDLFHRAGAMLREAFRHAHTLGVKTCVGTETPLVVPRMVHSHIKPGPVLCRPVGGQIAGYNDPIADTDDDPLYQTVRYNLPGYHIAVPNGPCSVTLKFSEVAYNTPGARVFGVKLQGRQVIDRLDIFAKVGKDKALDFTFPDVPVSNGTLEIEFVPQVEFPCISAIVVEAPGVTRKVNCGGPAYKDYTADGSPPPLDPADIRTLYEGIFLRAMKTYPLDYYWFWTPEGWTWEKVPDAQIEATIADLNLAVAAAKAVNAPFKLATCGWVLGPPKDRALFDKVLPRDMAVSCINRQVGHDPVEPGFANVGNRPKWAIPWLEDDPAMISPQLWVGRMRKDALDARNYGCTGLMGIHWRTRIIGPNVAAIAQAAWQQPPTAPPPTSRPGDNRHLASDDFYLDWARQNFGPDAAEKIAALFAKIDGKLPRPSDWVGGPGGIKPDPRPWEQVCKEYSFVDELVQLSFTIDGPGNSERFGYWLNNLLYLRANAHVNCTWAKYNDAVKKVKEQKDPDARKRLAREIALPLRKELVRRVAEVYTHLLATVSTSGEMGTVANWEQHIQPTLLTEPGNELAQLLGEPLPPDAQPRKDYAGPNRIIVPTIRSSIAPGEALTLKVIVLSNKPVREATLRWRIMGQGEFARIPLVHVARCVHTVTVPPAPPDATALEYYVQAGTDDGKTLQWPPTAPEINQTLVLAP